MTKILYLITGVLAGALLGQFAFSKQTETKILDPAKLAPQMYKLVLDNNILRAIDYHDKPGEKEPMHSHPTGVFVYFFTDANTRVTLSDGTTEESRNRAGDVVWRDPVTHFGENIGNSEVHALLIEPKNSCK